MMPELMLPVISLARYVQDPERAEYIARSWSMSNAEKNELVFICKFVGKRWSLSEIQQRVVLGEITTQNAVNILAAEERWDDYHAFRDWTIPLFPINGQMIMDWFNLSPGPEVGLKLNVAKGYWAATNYEADVATIMEALRLRT